MSRGLERYAELLDELLWRRAVGNPDDETEAYFAVALNDCRLEMTPDEEARIEEDRCSENCCLCAILTRPRRYRTSHDRRQATSNGCLNASHCSTCAFVARPRGRQCILLFARAH